MKKILSTLAAAALLLSCASAAPVTAAQEDADFAYLCTIPDAELEALCAAAGDGSRRSRAIDFFFVSCDNRSNTDMDNEGVQDIWRKAAETRRRSFACSW